MGKQDRQAVFQLPLLALTHVVKLIHEVLDVQCGEASGAQEFGGASRPLRVIGSIEFTQISRHGASPLGLEDEWAKA